MTRLNEVLNYKSKYSEGEVLKNKLGINNTEELEKKERLITTYKLATIYDNPELSGKFSFDVAHYLRIHYYLFNDIYEFAGTIRSENIKKTIPFCVPTLIYENLKNTLEKARNSAKKIQTEEDIVDFVTYYYSELDIIHPFREGNGRTAREFLRQYIIKINDMIDFGPYELDYSEIHDREKFISAVVKADAFCELDELKTIMSNVVKKKEKQYVGKTK